MNIIADYYAYGREAFLAFSNEDPTVVLEVMIIDKRYSTPFNFAKEEYTMQEL